MNILTKKEFESQKEALYKKIINDAIFIYPTDTIYGIGCNAQNSNSVKEIRRIKQRKETPFSIIAPSKEWIRENCIIDKKAEPWLNQLPGKLTLILKTKKNCVSEEVNPNLKTLGIRIPNHWFSQHVTEMNIPIITTSVNKEGEPYMTSLDDLDNNIKNNIDFIIYEGKKQANPSKLINLSNKFEMINR